MTEPCVPITMTAERLEYLSLSDRSFLTFPEKCELLAEVRAQMAARREADNQYVELQAVMEAILQAVAGEPVSEFMESFGPVRLVLDLCLDKTRLTAERDAARGEIERGKIGAADGR